MILLGSLNFPGELMGIVVDSRQKPLFDVRQFIPEPYKPGSFFFAMEKYASLVIRRDDFPAPDPSLGGADAWCPVYLSKLVLIQQKHGWDDRATIQHAATNLQVKACLCVGIDADAPSQSTLVRHRQLMQQMGLADVYARRFCDLLAALDLLDTVGAVAVDTVPVEGAGQVLDTYNLLGAAVRKGLAELAARDGRSVEELAASLSLASYLSRSIKGSVAIDWSDEKQQRDFLAQAVQDARTVRDALRSESGRETSGSQSTEVKTGRRGSRDRVEPGAAGPKSPGQPNESVREDKPNSDSAPDEDPSTPSGAADVAAVIDKIIEHDVEFDASGKVLGVLQRPAGDRLISVTDPDMRHGRKSASSLIAGYKVQVVATIMYGWILLTKVIPANRHDGEDLPWIIARLTALGIHPALVLGDHAYGVLANHRHVQGLNAAGPHPIELIARNARPSNGGQFSKDEFTIDMARRILTCPNGITCARPRIAMRGDQRGWRFEFPADACAACPLRKNCVNPKAKDGTARTVFIDPNSEPLIREHLTRRAEPSFISHLKQRQVVERANAGFAQCGGKHARRFGAANVEFDSAMSALAHNLRTLAGLARRDPKLSAALDQRSRLLFWLFGPHILLALHKQHATAPQSGRASLTSARRSFEAEIVASVLIRNLISRRLRRAAWMTNSGY